jgi:hypothetical protein
MTTKDKVARRKLYLLDIASDLSNVSRTCKVMRKALGAWLATDNGMHPHQGRNLNGRTPLRASINDLPDSASEPLAKPKREPLTTRSKQVSINNDPTSPRTASKCGTCRRLPSLYIPSPYFQYKKWKLFHEIQK